MSIVLSVKYYLLIYIVIVVRTKIMTLVCQIKETISFCNVAHGNNSYCLAILISFTRGSCPKFVYKTTALLSLQLPFEALEDARNTEMG